MHIPTLVTYTKFLDSNSAFSCFTEVLDVGNQCWRPCRAMATEPQLPERS